MKLPVRNIKQLGENLARIRNQQNLTQGKVGEKAGLRQATISALENGEVGSRLQTLFDILAVLNLELILQPRPNDDDLNAMLQEMLK